MNKDLLKKRFIELAERSYEKQIYTNTDFLSMDEISVFHTIKKQISHVPFTLFGGADACERQIIFFGSEDLCGYEFEIPIKCLKAEPLSPKFSEKLSHRDFLGALIGLGIDRSAIGDIFIKENTAHFFCMNSMAAYLIENYTQVRRTAISCILSDTLPDEIKPALQEISIQIASERLDSVIAHVLHLSRGSSSLLFQQEKVYVNSSLCTNSSFKPSVGDIISVRGYGRFLYNGIIGTSKKGKFNVSVSVYK